MVEYMHSLVMTAFWISGAGYACSRHAYGFMTYMLFLAFCWGVVNLVIGFARERGK